MEICEPRSAALTATQVLKDCYGFSAFRSPQDNIINDLIAGHDLLVLMPTGGGKSLCYQIPSIVRAGVGIIISPLIALMEDQVAALKLQGIRAAYYNSSLSSSESRAVLAQLHRNELDLLYIAPERLLTEAFLTRLQECTIALFAIDEAHCISQWGHDFRPEYAALGRLKAHFPHIPIIALTATADKQTQSDIIARLNYCPKQYIASFNRPNIHYQVIDKHNPYKQLQLFLQRHEQQSGIIYCGTRTTTERVASKLQELGYAARAYHAGLSHAERREVQTLFRYDRIEIVTATIAFGMGIDKPNVRFVVHFDLPKNIESYYQETGRAGRDGLPAHALLLYDPADSARLRSWIAESNAKQQPIEHYKLNHMLAFAEATHCRRQILLHYFAEQLSDPCQNCDICDNPPQTIDATIDAQKFLSCIYRLQQKYGLNHVIDVLQGRETEKLKQLNHDRLSTYGIGKSNSTAYWKKVAWQLIHRDYCVQDLAHYQVLRLTAKAIPVLRGKEQVALTLSNETVDLPPTKKKKSSPILPSEDQSLFENLRALRRRLAEEEDKPSFLIFSDATLHEMVQKKPTTLEQLLRISGVGQHKLTRYGSYFIEVLNKV